MIAGNLPWGGGGVNQFQGLGGSSQQSMQNLGTGYANAYNSALAMNQQNYSNVLQGYQQTLNQNTAARGALGGFYSDLTNSVLGGIADIGQSRQNDINAQYTQNSGVLAQQLINRGLGNSTVQGSMQRGVAYDQARSSTDLANQIAQTTAGYRSQLGLASLANTERSINANSQDAQNQLGWMNSVNAQYPDAGMYAQLAQQFGAANQQEKDRNLAMGRGLSNPPPSGGGYVPSGGGMPPSHAGAGSYGFSQPGYGVPGGATSDLPGFAPDAQVLGIGAGAYGAAAGAGEGMGDYFSQGQYQGGNAGQAAGGAGGGIADLYGGISGWAGGNPGYGDMQQYPQDSYA